MEISELLDILTDEISRVPGVSAIVLGGSRARGTHDQSSDVDLGIYYQPDEPLDLDALNRVASKFDDEHRSSALTLLGEWGPWINGGGWLKINHMPVDFLYRDLHKIGNVIQACRQGLVEMAYQPGHPHGFVSSIYMGEVSVCKLLWENPQGELSALKSLTSPYSPALKHALISNFAWEVEFSLSIAEKAGLRGDVVYAAGCCFRAAACLLQILFAINEQYWLNEKGAVAIVQSLPRRPEDFQSRIESAFSKLAPSHPAILSAIQIIKALNDETSALINNQ